MLRIGMESARITKSIRKRQKNRSKIAHWVWFERTVRPKVGRRPTDKQATQQKKKANEKECVPRVSEWNKKTISDRQKSYHIIIVIIKFGVARRQNEERQKCENCVPNAFLRQLASEKSNVIKREKQHHKKNIENGKGGNERKKWVKKRRKRIKSGSKMKKRKRRKKRLNTRVAQFMRKIKRANGRSSYEAWVDDNQQMINGYWGRVPGDLDGQQWWSKQKRKGREAASAVVHPECCRGQHLKRIVKMIIDRKCRCLGPTKMCKFKWTNRRQV